MKLVLFSDLHLDAQFAWLGRGEIARRRRQAQRDTLRRIVALALEERADALLCGGDLYEHDRFTPDTAAFLQRTFADLYPMRVFLAPGNHDWYGPGSLYKYVKWSNNVHLFVEPRLSPVRLADGLTLWGAAHRAPAGTESFLDGFRVDRGGVHLGLFHGSERAALRVEGDDKHPHAPFDREDIVRAGLQHALLGHYHTPRWTDTHTYPGNPEPLAFGETGPRGAVVVTIASDGRLECRWVAVAQTQLHDVECDVSGSESRQEVLDRIVSALDGLQGIARVRVSGELAPSVEIAPRDLDTPALRERTPALEAIVVRVGDLRTGYDVDAIEREPTVRGQFVRDVRAAKDLDADLRRRVIATGLRALDGRADLEVP